LASLEAAGGGPGVPAVAGAGLADEDTDGDEGGGEVEEEVHDLAVFIGFGAAEEPISTPLLVAAVLGVGVAIALWRLYFDVLSRAAEHRLADAQAKARIRMALQAYSSGHFPIVAGIILIALGLESVVAHADDAEPLGAFSTLAFYGGAAVYLIGQLIFKHGVHGRFNWPRLVTAVVLLTAAPAAMLTPPLVALSGLVVILAGLAMVEWFRYAELRHQLPDG
jgi:low temperature requirement protein LtrA